MKAKVAAIVTILIIILLGIWLSIPNDKSDKAVWPTETNTCVKFFGSSNAAQVLCGIVGILVNTGIAWDSQ